MDIQTLKKKNICSGISNYIDEFLPFQKEHQTKMEYILKEIPRSGDVFRNYWIKEAEKGNEHVKFWIHDSDYNLWRPAKVRTCMLYRGIEDDGYPATLIEVEKYKSYYYYELDSLLNTKWKIIE